MDEAALSVIAKALWDPNPTTSDLQSCQLAQALGYPEGWRVVRQKTATDDSAVLFDRIYSGDPTTLECDVWINHAGAMEAASTWHEKTNPSQFAYRGGHLTPMQSPFQKGDQVQVLYQDEWWDAKIMRVKENTANHSFKYQVYYKADSSKQSGVDQSLIRPAQGSSDGMDPAAAAVRLGFPNDWQAFQTGRNRWKIISPTGEIFKSKKTALASLDEDNGESSGNNNEEGDPPWRTEGDPYIGRPIMKITEHRVSARRTITIEQSGTVVGWISENDVDKEGNPGFVSDRTGKPAKLYHVKYELDNHTAYADQQLSQQDMEEYELQELLLPGDPLFRSHPNEPVDNNIASSAESHVASVSDTGTPAHAKQSPIIPMDVTRQDTGSATKPNTGDGKVADDSITSHGDSPMKGTSATETKTAPQTDATGPITSDSATASAASPSSSEKRPLADAAEQDTAAKELHQDNVKVTDDSITSNGDSAMELMSATETKTDATGRITSTDSAITSAASPPLLGKRPLEAASLGQDAATKELHQDDVKVADESETSTVTKTNAVIDEEKKTVPLTNPAITVPITATDSTTTSTDAPTGVLGKRPVGEAPEASVDDEKNNKRQRTE